MLSTTEAGINVAAKCKAPAVVSTVLLEVFQLERALCGTILTTGTSPLEQCIACHGVRLGPCKQFLKWPLFIK